MGPGELTVPIHGIGSRGEGVGRLPDGRTVFVHRAAPGDTVRVELTREADRWARGRLRAVLDSSEERRAPPCPYYAQCGGCSQQHLPYAAQLRWKRVRVEEAFQRIGGTVAAVEPVRPSPDEFHYRSRVTVHLRRLAGARVVAGFHELHRPGRILDVDGACLVMDPVVSEAWDQLRAGWGADARRLPAGRRLDLTLQRAGQRVVLVVRGATGQGDPVTLLQVAPRLAAIWAVGPDGAGLLAGSATVLADDEVDPVPVGPTGFQQVNRPAAELLWTLLREEVGPVSGLSIVDAYCGAGRLGRRWAREGARVTGIEVDANATRAAADGAPAGFHVRTGRVEDRLAETLPADLVVLNPPRSGADGAVLTTLLDQPPRRLFYVSCDPATLARDAARLSEAFELIRLQPVDLFPQTGHVEILASLRAR